MREYTLIKHKENGHSEIVSVETITGLRKLLNELYTFYDEYTAEPSLKRDIKQFTADEIRQRLKLYGYYTVMK